VVVVVVVSMVCLGMEATMQAFVDVSEWMDGWAY